MAHPLRVHIESVCKLTDEEFDYILTHFTIVKYKKHNHLIREGDLVKSEYFVLKGCLRAYLTDANTGKEFTYSFAAENWWVSEREAYTKRIPAATTLYSLLHDAKPGELNDLLHQNFLDSIVETSITAFLVKANDKLILIDAGSGSFMGSTLGKVKQNLLVAGIMPEDIDVLLPTHLHADHVGGLVDNGKMVFPNATVYISKPEAGFWLNDANRQTSNKRAQPFFDGAQAAVAPYQNEIC